MTIFICHLQEGIYANALTILQMRDRYYRSAVVTVE